MLQATSNSMSATESVDAVPLCVDLDGTLIYSDLLHESLAKLLGDRPQRILRVPGWWRAGRAMLKHQVAQEVDLDMTRLPYRTDFLDWLREQKAAGRSLWLTTASCEKYAQAVADHLGLFDKVIASDAHHNRRGVTKIAAIREQAANGFDYAGDSDADVPIVQVCRRMVLVAPSARLAAAAHEAGRVERVFGNTSDDTPENTSRRGRGALLKLLRPHQWTKNLLVFVPLVAGHKLGELGLVFFAFLGFLAFCAAASAIYIVNDLVDIESDRVHQTKRKRPLAAGLVRIPVAMATAGVLLLAAGVLALMAGGAAFLGWVGIYLGLTTAYSFGLKRRVLVDVLLLAWLYTHRVMGGGVVVGIVLSHWLIAFSSFMFLSLAFVKRYAELSRTQEGEINHRRGYRLCDLPLIGSVGPSCGLAATLVLALYIQSDMSATLYHRPHMLWLMLPLVLFWILRVWLLAFRRELDEDPITFAIHDRMSYVCLVAAVGVMLLAS
ncbi:MAG: UbiA family prenyltransferase [Algisphaera sp.]